MEYLTTVVLCFSLFGLGLYWVLYRRFQYYLPKGPWGLPVLGYVPFLSHESFRDFWQLTETYGSVFSLYLARSYTIVLNDYESVKEAFNNSAVWDRPPDNFDLVPGGLGLSSISGDAWMEQRRHFMKTIRENKFEEIVKDEVEDFVKMIESHSGRPLNIFYSLYESIAKNTLGIFMDRRLSPDDQAITTVVDGVNSFMTILDNAGLTSLLPNIMALFYKMRISRFAVHYQNLVTFHCVLKKEVEKRKNVPMEGLEETFIDNYLKEIHKSKSGVENSFTEQNLVGNSTSLLNGGIETARSSILWLMLALAIHPRVQKKLHEEIDAVMGSEGRIGWTDRSKLPYTYAAIMEGQRWRTVVPLSLPHRTRTDVKLCGYDVPKDTNVLSNLWALHNDPKHWEKPEEFVPERFLEENGTLKAKKPYSYAPFSLGRRNCPGDTVALMEILHYVVPILQKFQVLPEDEDNLPNLKGTSSIVYQPIPQNLRFVSRI